MCIISMYFFFFFVLQISTKKENHWRLGPENLNETVAYDFLGTE